MLRFILLLAWLAAILHAGNTVTINNMDDIIVFGGNITQTVLTPTLSELLRALTSTNPKVALAMGQTYGGTNAQLAWQWLLTQYPPFQTPLDFESGLFAVNGSTVYDFNILMWQLSLVMTNYVQPGCASGWVPQWTEQLVVQCNQLLDIDVLGALGSTIAWSVIVILGVTIALSFTYFVMGMYFKSRARKVY